MTVTPAAAPARPPSWMTSVLVILAVLALGFPIGWLGGRLLAHHRASLAPDDPVAAQIAHGLTASPGDRALAAAYRARGFRPIWFHGGRLDPAAGRLIGLIARSADDGLNPAAFDPADLSASLRMAQGGAPRAQAQADIALSRTLARWLGALHGGPQLGRFEYADPSLAPAPPTALNVLAAAGRAPNLSAWLDGATRMNPLYAALRQAWSLQRAAGASPRLAAIVRANLDRLRVLPVDLGSTNVVVNAATAQMRLSGGAPLAMEAVVGKPSEPTPQFAGVLRYVVLSPYWNVPADLDREFARRVLAHGPGYLGAHHFEVFPDFSAGAAPVDPASVDWRAVAAGALTPRIRQLPGPDNMLGQVKFIFPNRFGVYMHDTPFKSLFGAAQRTFSSGCIRLRDAAALKRRLIGDVQPSGAPEQVIPIARPIPVYVTYQTATPGPHGVVLHADIYHRDPA